MNREDNFFLTQFIFSLITEMDLVNKFWILTVGFIFCYVVRVFGELNCFSCDGDKSLSDCERTQFERLSCKKINKTAACYIVQRFTKKGKGPSFGKHCTTLEMCKKICRGLQPEDCKVHCCTTPLCNKSTYTASPASLFVSNILLIFLTISLFTVSILH